MKSASRMKTCMAPNTARITLALSDEFLQRVEKSQSVSQMHVAAVAGHQPEAIPISRSVGNSAVRPAFGDLSRAEADCVSTVAFDFIFPADDPRLGKPFAQFGNDFRRRHQLGEQRAVTRRNFAGF